MTTPKPDARITPSQDEFDSWCEHPVTRYVAAAYTAAALAQREAWVRDSWPPVIGDVEYEPEPNLVARRVYRARADAYSAFLETGLQQYVKLNTQDQ